MSSPHPSLISESSLTTTPKQPPEQRQGRRKNNIVELFLLLALFAAFTNLAYILRKNKTNNQSTINNDAPILEEIITSHEGNKPTISNIKLEIDPTLDWRSAKVVFQQIQQRALSSKQTCDGFIPAPTITQINMITDTKLLPEFGITDAVSSWLSKEEDSIPTEEMCRLPPPKACGEVGWTVIFMSYADSKNLGKLVGNIMTVIFWGETKEVVLVWNSPKKFIPDSILNVERSQQKFRMFYALENGLSNNLFNRYHPAIKPKTQAVLYFDDDGPIFKQRAMQIGFELWKRNAGVQVGCYARNFRFDNPDKRMHNMMETEIEVSERQILNGWQSVSPYDNQGTKQALSHIKTLDENKDRHPRFIPTCRSKTGDNLSYNWEYFHPYRAHMTLPSGTFMHRDFLCFMWHPVFEDLRQYVLDHPTHPDDVTASTIVSQVAGKALRTFTRRTKTRKTHDEDLINGAKKDAKNDVDNANARATKAEFDLQSARKELKKIKKKVNGGKRRLSVWPIQDHTKESEIDDLRDMSSDFMDNLHLVNDRIGPNNSTEAESQPNKLRRRLLFKQENWGEMRTEAANSITGYFGSINPGSVGYCFGTSAINKDEKSCSVNINNIFDVSIEEEVPWIWEGMLGHDQC